MLGLGRVDAAAGEEHVHGDMIGNAARQLDRGGIRHGARIDFGQREGCMFGGDDDVAGDHDLEAAAEGEAIHGADHRLVEARQFLQAAEAADAIVGIRRFARGRGLQIPAGAEELLAGRR